MIFLGLVILVLFIYLIFDKLLSKILEVYNKVIQYYLKNFES